ncbi:MAG: geranylgeranylglycerol-phosphate geranylgeranyltransferase [Candidatus Altiarchaeia archaeon]
MKKEKVLDRITAKIQLFLDLIRVRNCSMTFIAVLLGASFIDFGQVFTIKVIMAGLAAFIITGAGNIINDYFDYEIDRINRPHRALPSNKISKSDAMMLSMALFAIGLGMSKYVNIYCFLIALSNVAVLLTYGKYSKKMYLLSNMIVSYLVASIFVYGAFANQTGTDFLEMGKFQMVALLSACAFFATLSREIMKDIEDIEGDRKKYAITLPIRLGVEKALEVSKTFIFIAMILSLAPFYPGFAPERFNLFFYGVFILIADAMFISSLRMHPSLSQRAMIAGMGMSIVAFFSGELLSALI